jgi:dipeptidyl aminopeptidase/acylaminoacyl peptidase
MRRSLNIFFMLACLSVGAQMPDTDLWLFKLTKDKTGRLFPDKPVNITNRPGYDNQPSFSPDGKKIYYVSVREDKQADIYAYAIGSGKITQLTKTKESEYSPVAESSGKTLHAVVVESDSAQRIHYINAEKGTFESKLQFDSVGYYTFMNADTVVYYKLTQPHSLRFHVLKTGEDKWLGNSPTRTFRALDRHTLIYGLKDSSKVAFYKFDFALQKAERYCDYPSLNEDIVWHPEMGLLKSEEAKLYRFAESKKEWELLYDLGLFGVKKITRFAFDPKNKYLVIVNNL